MADRAVAERLIKELHTQRVAGNLAEMCRLFAEDGRFEILGASADRPISIRAAGLAEFRPWLAMMTKVFRLNNYALLSLVVEWPRATAHWRADIHSKVTGAIVPTELVDLVEIRSEKIQTYNEIFVPL